MTRVIASALVAGSLFLSVSSLRARQAPEAPPIFHAGTDVVQVDVSVLDKDRKPVRGLTAADFTVLEDGKPRPIVAFSPVDLPNVVHETTAWAHDVAPDAEVTTNTLAPEGRLVVIMMDWSMRPQEQPAARRIARAAVDNLGPDDLAAITFTSAFSNGGVAQDFTRDRARLIADINRPFAAPLVTSASGYVQIEDPNGVQSGDCLCRLCVMETVESVADALRDIPNRRKVVMFIGSYFFAVDDAAPSFLTSYQASAATAAGPGQRPPNIGGLVGGDTQGVCRGRVDEAREKMLRSLGLANLTVDVVDPVGLASPENPVLLGVDETTRQTRLSYLADATGGRRVMNTNAPEEFVPAIFAETQAYYLLGFEPDKKTGHISVKVNRPGMTVRSRDAYRRSRGGRARRDDGEAGALRAGHEQLVTARGSAARGRRRAIRLGRE